MSKKNTLLFCSLLYSSMQLHAMEDELKKTSVQENLTAGKEASKIYAFASAVFEPFAGVITGSKVRIRTQPSLEAHVVRESIPGEMFAVMADAQDYFAISPPKGTKGYVFRTFILDGQVEGERVNIRLYPDMDAPVVGQLNRGDQIHAQLSDINNKWLEIDLPESCRFFIAKEYIERKGPVELVATLEKRRGEASHHLSAASLFAQAEFQKPFELIDLDRVQEKFRHISKDYHDQPTITERVQEISNLLQDVYVQKKVAFLERKSGEMGKLCSIDKDNIDRLTKLGIDIKPTMEEKQTSLIASAASQTVGLATTIGEETITDKMLLWQPIEESIYHLWVAANGEKSMEEFYQEEKESASMLSGILEAYNRPVKNRPGDFLLRSDHMPVAFLYSTHINLENLVGKKVTVLGAPRPNHNFAFPAYYVISIE
jgi:hypothetical protein